MKAGGFHRTCLSSAAVSLFPPAPLFFVSDLHLGDGSATDDFAEHRHREAFEWFLDEVEADGGELTLVGDIFELWQASLHDIRGRYFRLYRRILNHRLLRGNHDSAYRAPPEWLWPDPVEPVLLAEHGHQADIWNSTLGIVGRSVTWAAAVLERLGWRDVDNWKFRHMPTPVSHPRLLPLNHYADYARKRAAETGAQLVVLGHTHRPGLRHLTDDNGRRFVYVNAGTWTRPDFEGSYVKVYDGRVSVWKIT